MKDLTQSLRWDSAKRMEEIERCLYWQGSLSRKEVAWRLRLSNPQATAVLRLYQDLNPEKIHLNHRSKRYEVRDEIPYQFYEPTLEDLGLYGETFDIDSTFLQPPSRRLPMEVIRDIARAIHGQKSLLITYHSSKDPDGRERRITPHTFVTTSRRTHVRAWCHLREGFRDFIIGRITATGKVDEPGKVKEDDADWHENLTMSLKPNPKLTSAQQKMIQMDFEMDNGIKHLEIPKALLWYYFELYNLWPEHPIQDPLLQPVILANTDALKYLKRQ